MTSSWSETILPTILPNYKLEDIFNAVEFGVFYKCLPDKTYHLKGEKCSGEKKRKVRLTGMAAASATGEKLPMFVIWKSKNPRCFKNVKHLPCEYKSQKKSWMNSEIFEEWVRKLDRKFRADDRKIALIINNCPAHPSISNLTNVPIVFCPQIPRPFFNRWTKVSYAALKRIFEEALCVCYAELWTKKSLVQRFEFCNQ